MGPEVSWEAFAGAPGSVDAMKQGSRGLKFCGRHRGSHARLSGMNEHRYQTHAIQVIETTTHTTQGYWDGEGARMVWGAFEIRAQGFSLGSGLQENSCPQCLTCDGCCQNMMDHYTVLHCMRVGNHQTRPTDTRQRCMHVSQGCWHTPACCCDAGAGVQIAVSPRMQ